MDPILQALLSALGFLGTSAVEGTKIAGKGLVEGGKAIGKGGSSLFNALLGADSSTKGITDAVSRSIPQASQMGNNLPDVLPQPTVPITPPTIPSIEQVPNVQQSSIPMNILKGAGKAVGIGRGPEGKIGIPEAFGKGLLGMPMDQERMGLESYIGKLYPDIFRSKLGVNTTQDEARQQQIMKNYADKKITPEYKTDLENAVTRLPQLDEQGKVLLYQQLAVQYPERSSELKRIFFPQSQDSNDALMALIASGQLR